MIPPPPIKSARPRKRKKTMLYFRHPRGWLASTNSECIGAIYQSHRYVLITQRQYQAALARRDRDDERYERNVKRLERRLQRGAKR